MVLKLFGSKVTCDRIVNSVILNMNSNAYPVVREARNLGFVIVNIFRHVTKCLKQAYFSLKAIDHLHGCV